MNCEISIYCPSSTVWVVHRNCIRRLSQNKEEQFGKKLKMHMERLLSFSWSWFTEYFPSQKTCKQSSGCRGCSRHFTVDHLVKA